MPYVTLSSQTLEDIQSFRQCSFVFYPIVGGCVDNKIFSDLLPSGVVKGYKNHHGFFEGHVPFINLVSSFGGHGTIIGIGFL